MTLISPQLIWGERKTDLNPNSFICINAHWELQSDIAEAVFPFSLGPDAAQTHLSSSSEPRQLHFRDLEHRVLTFGISGYFFAFKDSGKWVARPETLSNPLQKNIVATNKRQFLHTLLWISNLLCMESNQDFVLKAKKCSDSRRGVMASKESNWLQHSTAVQLLKIHSMVPDIPANTNASSFKQFVNFG